MPFTVRQRANMQLKNPVLKRSASRKKSQGDCIVISAPTEFRGIAYPGGALALSLLVGSRLLSAFFNHIGDCDETYNYWEPLHYLLYGSGFQTWEYSPAYALRSYASLWVFGIPGKLLSYIMAPVSVFYTLRIALTMMSAWAELMFYKAVCQEFGVNVGRMWLYLAVPAAGCFASSSAMLPSAWSGSLCTAALACWWKRRYAPAIAMIAISVLLSWPFTVLIGVPIALDILFIKRKFLDFFKWSTLSLILILVPMVAVDSWHYGKLVVAPWNIVKYNVFSDQGPSLFGEEHWTFYFLNVFLNFNVVWVLALCCVMLYAACQLLVAQSTSRAEFCNPMWLNLMPVMLWLAVFMLQAHKEERFLYPVYSMIVLAGAISFDCALKLMYAMTVEILRYGRTKRVRHYLAYASDMFMLFGAAATAISVSRIVQVHNNYHGPMTILSHLPKSGHGVSYVCYGKDWYRSPSSFHVTDAYRLRFIQSEFQGQMPAPYDEDNDTRAVHPYFNDRNKGDSRTYLKPHQCHYLVDSDIGRPTALEPAYHLDSRKWEVIASVPVLDMDKSKTLFRAFYVPLVNKRSLVYANMYLLRNKQLGRK